MCVNLTFETRRLAELTSAREEALRLRLRPRRPGGAATRFPAAPRGAEEDDEEDEEGTSSLLLLRPRTALTAHATAAAPPLTQKEVRRPVLLEGDTNLASVFCFFSPPPGLGGGGLAAAAAAFMVLSRSSCLLSGASGSVLGAPAAVFSAPPSCTSAPEKRSPFGATFAGVAMPGGPRGPQPVRARAALRRAEQKPECSASLSVLLLFSGDVG